MNEDYNNYYGKLMLISSHVRRNKESPEISRHDI